MTKTMDAVYITKQGKPNLLTFGKIKYPEINDKEVIIKVEACSINRLDIFTRTGQKGLRKKLTKPLILGGDAAGTVIEKGTKVPNFVIGQRVIIRPKITCTKCYYCINKKDAYCNNFVFLGTDINGSYAQYLAIDHHNVFPIVDSIPFEIAAAISTTYSPCWNLMKTKHKIKRSDTILIASASSGVGTAAIDIASSIGTTIITTTSSNDKKTKALSIGANYVIIPTKENIQEKVLEITDGQGVDFVLDCVGSAFFEIAFNLLKNGGTYALCGVTSGHLSKIHLGQIFTKQLTITGTHMGAYEDMEEIVKVLNKNKLNPTIDSILPLNKAQFGHEKLENRMTFGKIILKP